MTRGPHAILVGGCAARRAGAVLLAVLAVGDAAGRARTAHGLGAVEGIVLGPEGRPVSWALVAAVPHAYGGALEDLVLPTIRTGPGGAFRFTRLPPGDYTMTATAAGLAATPRFGVRVAAGRTLAGADLSLRDEGTALWGVVRGPKGDPRRGAAVLALEWGRSPGVIFETVTGEDGHFALRLPPARYSILANDRSLQSPTRTLDVLVDDRLDLDLLPLATGPPPDAVRSWIRREGIRLRTVEPGNGFADMEPIRKIVGDARVVSLGEATHGTREFFQLKHRMLEFLASEMGFTAFAIEASFPDVLALDDYVTRGAGDPAAILAGLGFWTLDTEELLEMIRWMRRFNEDPAHSAKLRFYGIDMQNPPASAARLAEYLARVDPEFADVARAGLEPLSSSRSVARYASLGEAARHQTLDSLDAIRARLLERKDRDVEAGGERDWAIAVHLADVLVQGEALFRSSDGGYDVRDRAMAENVRWIMDSAPPGAKVVVWAHNGHVTVDPALPGGSMGSHLRQLLGSEMVVFGLSFDCGEFHAIDGPAGSGGGLRTFAVGPAPPKSLDAALASADAPVLALDLRAAPASGPVARWLRIPRPMRSIGAIYVESQAPSYFQRASPPAAYDAILFVERTTAARSNRPRAAPRRSPAASQSAAPDPGFAEAGRARTRAEDDAGSSPRSSPATRP